MPSPAASSMPDSDAAAPGRPNPIAVARGWLGARLAERPESGYWLDGRPVSLTAIMRETNRLIALEGLEPIGPEHWRA